MKINPETVVLDWLGQNEDVCFLSAITVGEIERGIELLSSGQKKHRLQEAFRDFLDVVEERILNFDTPTARRWAVLTAAAQRKGKRLPVLDSMIEATALRWDLTLVTRNTTDFFEALILNPWHPPI